MARVFLLLIPYHFDLFKGVFWLFQNSVDEKLARERTGHSSYALFGYQKASDKQVQNVSKVLAPVND